MSTTQESGRLGGGVLDNSQNESEYQLNRPSGGATSVDFTPTQKSLRQEERRAAKASLQAQID